MSRKTNLCFGSIFIIANDRVYIGSHFYKQHGRIQIVIEMLDFRFSLITPSSL